MIDLYQDSLIHLPIRPNDYDYAGYLNNAVYVEYLEAGRVAWAALNGINLFEPNIAPAVSRLELNYRKGLIRGQDAAEVHILTHLVEMKPVRLFFQQTISNSEEAICAQANLEIVMVNMQTKKAMPIRTALERLKGR